MIIRALWLYENNLLQLFVATAKALRCGYDLLYTHLRNPFFIFKGFNNIYRVQRYIFSFKTPAFFRKNMCFPSLCPLPFHVAAAF